MEKYMIGDYVNDTVLGDVRIVEVREGSVWVRHDSADYHLTNHEPIPLTAEILERCGFGYHKGHDSYKMEVIEGVIIELDYITTEDNYQLEIMTNGITEKYPWVLIDFPYLHNLQQFLYINFKHELKYNIKLKQ